MGWPGRVEQHQGFAGRAQGHGNYAAAIGVPARLLVEVVGGVGQGLNFGPGLRIQQHEGVVVGGIGASGYQAAAIGREGGGRVALAPANAREVAGLQVQHLQLGGYLLAPAGVLLVLGPHGFAAVHRQHFGDV
ncbi:hypothetical protein MON38_10005 [Hymenobacter sp. DH14]|uniref:Uncharacterized protein n=1 Tax=Hymenobacter cyanobacteriorum TaxID=2926463 RepID=A0A9X1VFQ2_9BACT|nr:hypothetical protein [Hymenobacter cyanobacteriorum]MCI1187753.1 hypothetical protein [Hymenobacter cyanobacteriorum]